VNDAIDVFLLLCAAIGAGGIGYLRRGRAAAVRRMERRAGLPGTPGAWPTRPRTGSPRSRGHDARRLERVDFAERMLARQREADRLDAGGR
jgi:hypothetical protein